MVLRRLNSKWERMPDHLQLDCDANDSTHGTDIADFSKTIRIYPVRSEQIRFENLTLLTGAADTR